MNGTFEDFLAALLALESGWDRIRYDAGEIQDHQLDRWAGGTVTDYYPDYPSWRALNEDEWRTMAYRSKNPHGFVGYQFGEALLVDLGYYRGGSCCGTRTPINEWNGDWTGKNGVGSLETFMSGTAQNLAIREALGYKLTIVQGLLDIYDESLSDYLGQTVHCADGDLVGSVELTVTGILAGAYVRGAPAMVQFLRSAPGGVDRFGKSLLKIIKRFGGYEAPTIDALIACFEDGPTGNGSDGSDLPSVAGTSDGAGSNYKVGYFSVNKVAFDADRDQIDFGETSAHTMIINKTPQGDLVIDNPWWDDMQITPGVQFSDLSVENFGVVGNTHLRQDIGGVLSWEIGVGPREKGTVYIRSHEYGVHKVIRKFDPDTMKISFLYYGTRNRLSVVDTPKGLVITTQPSGQSYTFTGLSLSDLQPGTLEFHHDQVMKSRLEEPFGFDKFDVGLVSREALLTPKAPAGADTGGHQIRKGVMWSVQENQSDTETEEAGIDLGVAGIVDKIRIGIGNATDGRQIQHFNWNWGARQIVPDFLLSKDDLPLGALPVRDVPPSKVEGRLHLEVFEGGGHNYVAGNTEIEDRIVKQLVVANWSGALDQLAASGKYFIPAAAQ
jgi:hypothetical protein